MTSRAIELLLRLDWRSILRDPLLRWILPLPVMLALALRFGVPAISPLIAERIAVDLLQLTPVLMVGLLLLLPMLTGTIVGFLFLDQKDEGTLLAIRVTPPGLQLYLLYRLLLPGFLSFVLTLACMPLAGLTQNSFWQLFFCALLAAPIAPLMALFLAVYAENKVQGFALQKALSFLLLPPTLAWFYEGSWTWLLGAVPTFWAAKLFWAQLAGASVLQQIVVIVAGMLWMLHLLYWLQRKLAKIAT